MPHPTRNTPPPGFAQLARRITIWTSNSLAIAVVVAGGLLVGRQFSGWLAISPQDVAGNSQLSSADVGLPDLGDPRQTHTLGFGSQPLALSRMAFVGDKSSLLQAMRGMCRAATPAEASVAGEAGVMESRLLVDIASQQPVEQKAGVWSMFQLDGPVPMVVVAHASLQRVLCWGLALPVDVKTQQWTLFCCTPSTGTAEETEDAALPAPPFGRRLLGVTSADGEAIVVWAGDGPVGRWLEYYDDWFAEQDWTIAEAWQESGGLYCGRFVHAQRREIVVATIEDGDQIKVTLAIAKQ